MEIRKIEAERIVLTKSSIVKQGTTKAAVSSKTDSSDDDRFKDKSAQDNAASILYNCLEAIR
jgi:hypothetical protein